MMNVPSDFAGWMAFCLVPGAAPSPSRFPLVSLSPPTRRFLRMCTTCDCVRFTHPNRTTACPDPTPTTHHTEHLASRLSTPGYPLYTVHTPALTVQGLLTVFLIEMFIKRQLKPKKSESPRPVIHDDGDLGDIVPPLPKPTPPPVPDPYPVILICHVPALSCPSVHPAQCLLCWPTSTIFVYGGASDAVRAPCGYSLYAYARPRSRHKGTAKG